ncbi:MAG: leucine-rich repeat domain-containing protein [Chitinophagales bacterium]
MRLSILFIFAICIVLANCSKEDDFRPIEVNSSCSSSSFTPFYEQQDANALSLSIYCDCLDTAIDLSNKLMAYTEVVDIDFNCEAAYFNQIPAMNSVRSLTSNTTTEHIISAFPYLEVYKNKSYTKEPLARELAFFGNLKEVVLLNTVNFPDFLATASWDVFKMTFQSTAEQAITLPSNLSVLRNLKELTIRDVVEVVRFTNYENLNSLKHLELSNILWVGIPETSNQWPNLKTLQISDVELRGSRTLPDIFEDMNSLESVYISGTEVSTNTQIHISKAPNLKELTFSFCEIGSIPDEIGDLANLNKLIIATDETTTIDIVLPLSVGNLSNLKSIFVSTNSNQFPVALLDLNSTLESMAIRDDIGAIPPEIGSFTALKELKLEYCGLTILPSEIQSIASTLEKLSLIGNGFSEAAKQQIEAWLPNTNIDF